MKTKVTQETPDRKLVEISMVDVNTSTEGDTTVVAVGQIGAVMNMDEDEIRRRSVLNAEVTKWDILEKEYEPSKHAIFTDMHTYPDKNIVDAEGNIVRIEKRTRVGIGLQKLAANRLAEFMFTLEPTLTQLIDEDEDEDTVDDIVFKLFKRMLRKVRWQAMNKERCKINSSECEQATYWYYVPTNNKNIYGKNYPTSFKLKYKIFSPAAGDTLYPLFDEHGDLVAFSREFVMVVNGVKIKFFESWDEAYYYRLSKNPSDTTWIMEEGYPKKNVTGKIPINYSYRKEPIWREADNGKIEEIEKILSNNGEILAYHSSPVLIIKGNLQGAPTKGEANKVFMTNGDGDAKYVSWEQSPEAIKFQYDSLMRSYFTELQLPDLSFDNIKSLGNVSGTAMEWLLTDAHLKVGDESDIYEVLFSRDLSIIKSYMKMFFTGLQDNIEALEIDFKINPFTIKDLKTKVDVLVSATGNKPILSQQAATALAGLVDDPKADYIKIQSEEAQDNTESIFPSANANV